jgi:F-type H+-transporting ATPase subunit b
MLDISLGLLIFTAVIFFVLIYLLEKTLYKPLLGFMKKREDLIRNDKESLEESGDEVEEALSRANASISEAKAEASKLREAEVAAAKEAAAKELALAKEAIDSKYEAFVKELSKERESLKKSLQANLSTYQGALSSKLKKV